MKFPLPLCVISLLLGSIACGAQKQSLRLIQTIPLPTVGARVGHMAVDTIRGRLFVAAPANKSVEVLDLKTGKRLHTITGMQQPVSLAFVAPSNRLYVAGAEGGACCGYDGVTFKRIAEIAYTDDTNCVRYDASADRILVGVANGQLAMNDAENWGNLGSFILKGRAEAVQVEQSGPRIYVTVPSACHIAVMDILKKADVATWPVTGARGIYPLAMDEREHRLFVGSRTPAKVLLFDTMTGKQVGSMETAGGIDDLFYDADTHRLYASCGAGALDVFREKDEEHFERTARITTRPGAGTSLFVAKLKRLYVGIPKLGAKPAEIRVYDTSQ